MDQDELDAKQSPRELAKVTPEKNIESNDNDQCDDDDDDDDVTEITGNGKRWQIHKRKQRKQCADSDAKAYMKWVKIEPMNSCNAIHTTMEIEDFSEKLKAELVYGINQYPHRLQKVIGEGKERQIKYQIYGGGNQRHPLRRVIDFTNESQTTLCY